MSLPGTFAPQYWVVWRENGAAPTVMHPNFAKAKSEAQRLASVNPGQRFVVLAAALAFEKIDVVEVRYGAAPWALQYDPDSHIPF